MARLAGNRRRATQEQVVDDEREEVGTTVPGPSAPEAANREIPVIPGWEIPGPTVVVDALSGREREPRNGKGGDDPHADEISRRDKPRPWLVALAAGAVAGALVGGIVAGVLHGSGNSSSSSTTVREVSPGPALSGGASIPAIVQQVAPQVVSIDAAGTSPTTGSFDNQGTGMILSTDGEVLTNNHVIAETTSVTVTLYGRTLALDASVVGTDPLHDLALLRINSPPAGLQPVVFGDSTQLQVGDAVIAIGNALGLSAGTPTVTSGIVSALGRTVQAGDVGGGQVENLSNMIQTDAAINSGNSGGALVDSVGQVIGMNTAVASSTADNAPAENIGFAIPSSTIRSLLPSLRAGGTVVAHRAYLGVEVEDLTPQLRQAYNFVPTQGAVVVRVVSGSPAATADIQQGDVIVGFDGKAVTSAASLTTAVGAAKPGDRATVTVWRGQRRMTISLTLGSTPEA
jgi:S1-C subfamily serine protease